LKNDVNLLQSSLETWDEVFQQIDDGGDLTYGFLQLARRDLQTVAPSITCGHCRRQIATEVRLIETVLQLSRLANEWTISKSARRKLQVGGLALPLVGRIAYLQFKKLF
jgi:hypothetical protein